MEPLMEETRFALWSPYEDLTLDQKIQICRNAVEFYGGMPGPIAERLADRRRALLQQLLNTRQQPSA
jgi:hypothetical protein